MDNIERVERRNERRAREMNRPATRAVRSLSETVLMFGCLAMLALGALLPVLGIVFIVRLIW